MSLASWGQAPVVCLSACWHLTSGNSRTHDWSSASSSCRGSPKLQAQVLSLCKSDGAPTALGAFCGFKRAKAVVYLRGARRFRVLPTVPTCEVVREVQRIDLIRVSCPKNINASLFCASPVAQAASNAARQPGTRVIRPLVRLPRPASVAPTPSTRTGPRRQLSGRQLFVGSCCVGAGAAAPPAVADDAAPRAAPRGSGRGRALVVV